MLSEFVTGKVLFHSSCVLTQHPFALLQRQISEVVSFETLRGVGSHPFVIVLEEKNYRNSIMPWMMASNSKIPFLKLTGKDSACSLFFLAA